MPSGAVFQQPARYSTILSSFLGGLVQVPATSHLLKNLLDRSSAGRAQEVILA